MSRDDLPRVNLVEKRCPECGRLLVVRRNVESGDKFLGCSGWPDHCRHTEPLPESVRMRMAGAMTLPGME